MSAALKMMWKDNTEYKESIVCRLLSPESLTVSQNGRTYIGYGSNADFTPDNSASRIGVLRECHWVVWLRPQRLMRCAWHYQWYKLYHSRPYMWSCRWYWRSAVMSSYQLLPSSFWSLHSISWYFSENWRAGWTVGDGAFIILIRIAAGMLLDSRIALTIWLWIFHGTIFIILPALWMAAFP